VLIANVVGLVYFGVDACSVSMPGTITNLQDFITLWVAECSRSIYFTM